MVHCMGGHGRTGTALCIMAGLLDESLRNDDLMENIREMHCPHAVESQGRLLISISF
jgi:protein-tyrosine phosphatase